MANNRKKEIDLMIRGIDADIAVLNAQKNVLKLEKSSMSVKKVKPAVVSTTTTNKPNEVNSTNKR
jgi:hypothetical protein